MTAVTGLDDTERQRSLRGLVGLVVGLAGCAFVLHQFAGLPHLPRQVPTWEAVVATLRGAYLAPEVMTAVLATAAWLVWLWIAASVALRLLVSVGDALARGAAWVEHLRAISDRVTLPLVRRAVDAALVAVVVVNVAARTPGPIAAAAMQPMATSAAAVVASPGGTPASPDALAQPEPGRTVQYTVQPGDTLWTISARFYGAGDEFPRLVAANAGRVMPDGRRFTQAGVIHAGWVLLIPSPTQGAGQVAAGDNSYNVEPGDTLRSIAARFLGNEARWPEIFTLNVGTARVNGHVLTDPDLIWPGLMLRLPGQTTSGALPAPPPAPPIPPHTQPPDELPRPVESVPPPSPAASTATPTAQGTPDTTPAPIGPEMIVAPTAVAVPQPEVTSGHGDNQPLPMPYGPVGLTAAALAAGTALLLRRRVRRRLDEPPVPLPVRLRAAPIDAFAEAAPVHAVMHRLDDVEVEPAVIVATQARRFLRAEGMPSVTVVLAYEGRRGIILFLDAGSARAERLVELATPFGARVGATVRPAVTVEGDVLWQVMYSAIARLHMASVTDGEDALPLVALGVASSGDAVYANWRALGHVLIAGLPGGGTDTVLTALVAGLASRCPPEALHLVVLGSRRALPRQLAALPHLRRDPVDLDDAVSVTGVLDEIRAELLRRMRDGDGQRAWGGEAAPDQPEVVLVTDALDALGEHGTTLELIGTHGPRHGIRLLAATTEPDSLGEAVLAHFTTRLVLQLVDDESVRLLGRPDAADLGSGEFLLGIPRREPVRLRGFHVSDARLDELVRLARGAYDVESWPTELAAPTPVDPEPDASPEQRDEHPTADVLKETPSVAREEQPVLAVGAERPDAPAGPGAVLEADESCQVDAVPAGAAPSVEVGKAEPTAEDDDQPGRDAGEAEHEPLLEIRCLGEFSVRGGEREIEPVDEDGRGYKAWEVLAFLAVQPGMATGKEKLLAAVWPDTDELRAGNRMRVAMARLRTLLTRQDPVVTAEVVTCERDGTCRLDSEQVWSDAAEFLSRCRDGTRLPAEQAKPALERARSLYHGDVHTGLGARSYDWLDERDDTGLSPRERYREEYYRATQQLARIYSRAGHPELAIPLYKDILKSEPTLEDIVRELYRCYAGLGDLSSLIREDRHLRQQLREAYADPDDPDDDPEQYQPEPETVKLFDRIRAELEARVLASARHGSTR